MRRSFTKYPVTASQERGTVQTYRNRRNPNKYIEVKKGNDGHSYARQYMEWDTPDGKVKNYTGAKDAKRGRYHRARRDTIDQMLEDYDAVEGSTYYGMPDMSLENGLLSYNGYTFDEPALEDLIWNGELGSFNRDYQTIEEFGDYMRTDLRKILDGVISNYENFGSDMFDLILN